MSKSLQAPQRGAALALFGVWLCLATLFGCSDDKASSDTTAMAGGGQGGSGGSKAEGGGGSQSSADAVTAAVLDACPQAAMLIDTTDWPDCLAGKRLVGKDPFASKACELRIGEDGAFDYLIEGSVTLSIPARSGWGNNARGTYQNAKGAGGRLFLASLSPDLPLSDGQAVIDKVSLSVAELPSLQDTVEISYFDENRARKTYNCTVGAL